MANHSDHVSSREAAAYRHMIQKLRDTHNLSWGQIFDQARIAKVVNSEAGKNRIEILQDTYRSKPGREIYDAVQALYRDLEHKRAKEAPAPSSNGNGKVPAEDGDGGAQQRYDAARSVADSLRERHDFKWADVDRAFGYAGSGSSVLTSIGAEPKPAEEAVSLPPWWRISQAQAVLRELDEGGSLETYMEKTYTAQPTAAVAEEPEGEPDKYATPVAEGGYGINDESEEGLPAAREAIEEAIRATQNAASAVAAAAKKPPAGLPPFLRAVYTTELQDKAGSLGEFRDMMLNLLAELED